MVRHNRALIRMKDRKFNQYINWMYSEAVKCCYVKVDLTYYNKILMSWTEFNYTDIKGFEVGKVKRRISEERY